MPPVLFWACFICLVVAYLLGVASILLSQWFGRHSIERRLLRAQEEDRAMDEGYVLRVLHSPRHGDGSKGT